MFETATTGCSLYRMLRVCSCVMIASCILQPPVEANEDITLDLAKMEFEPLIQFYRPPANSRDAYKFTRQGLLVRQFDDLKDKVPWTAGFKSVLTSSGDFRVQLDLDLRIRKPDSGWGQGVALVVSFDDVERTKIKLLRCAKPSEGQSVQVELSGLKVATPIYRNEPSNMTSGSLVIERIGSEATLSIIDKNRTIEIDRLECPTTKVENFEVVCTRLGKGNTEASYLFKKLHVSADQFFAFDPGRERGINWWFWMFFFQVFVLGSLLYWKWKRSG